MNTEIEKQEGEQLIYRKDIEGSPFTIVKAQGECFLTMGRYKISPPMTEEEIPIWMMENEWNIIAIIAGIIAENSVETNNKRQWPYGNHAEQKQ